MLSVLSYQDPSMSNSEQYENNSNMIPKESKQNEEEDLRRTIKISNNKNTTFNDSNKKMKRQIMKIHGVSLTESGELLFAVSCAKSKSFQYFTNRKMKEEYPNYLIGFYERNLKIVSNSCTEQNSKTKYFYPLIQMKQNN